MKREHVKDPAANRNSFSPCRQTGGQGKGDSYTREREKERERGRHTQMRHEQVWSSSDEQTDVMGLIQLEPGISETPQTRGG